jgi:cystathionine gamma-synthase
LDKWYEISVGLQTHLGHDIAKSQMRGFGGMLSFALDGGYNLAEKFLPSLNRVHLATTLGSVITFVGLFHTTSQRGINRNAAYLFGYSRKFIPLFSRN